MSLSTYPPILELEVGYDEYSRFEGFNLAGDCVAENQEVNTTTRYSKKTSEVPSVALTFTFNHLQLREHSGCATIENKPTI